MHYTGLGRHGEIGDGLTGLLNAAQRGTAFLTTSTKPDRIRDNFDISTLPEEAMHEMREGIKTNVRFNTVVETGVPGFIPRNR